MYKRQVEAYADTLEGDVRTGAKIILRALEEPIRQIAENAGFEGSVVVAAVKEQEVGVGFNAKTEEYVDMIADGIVDPVKVTRSATVSYTHLDVDKRQGCKEWFSSKRKRIACGGQSDYG